MLGEMALNRTRALMAGKQGQDEGTHRNKEAPRGDGGGWGGSTVRALKGEGCVVQVRTKAEGPED